MTENSDEQKKYEHEQVEKIDITEKKSNNIASNPFMWISAVLLIGVIVLGVLLYQSYNVNPNTDADIVSKTQISKDLETQLNNMLTGQATVNVKAVSEKNGMYYVNMTVDGKQGTENLNAYVTKDGNYMFLQPFDLKNIPKPSASAESQQPVDVPKSDKPKVELFIMSYCPFGLQAQKAALPVMSLLKDQADMTINWVSYAMHGEKEVYENLRQYCIQKENKIEYIKYMTEFVQTDDYKTALSKTSLSEDKINTCMNATDLKYGITRDLNNKSTWMGSYPPFNIEKDLNQLYGVRGSPTLVINGKEVSVSRSPEAIKTAVCNAFNTKPSECDTVLSTNQAAPGIGSLDAKYNNDIQANCG